MQENVSNASLFDFDAIRAAINEKTKIVYIQRSKGYVNRPSFCFEDMKEAIDFVRSIRKDVIVKSLGSAGDSFNHFGNLYDCAECVDFLIYAACVFLHVVC